MLTKDSAICIRTVDYSETSQVVTFFTKKNGKIGTIAKGSKRPKSPFDGPVEMFSVGQIVFTQHAEGKLDILTEFQQQPAFSHLASNLFALNTSLFAAEMINKLTDDYDPHIALFDSFLLFLQNTQAAKSKSGILAQLVLFQLALLKEAGLMLILNACVNCKNAYKANWRQTYFSSSANGLVCRDCEAGFPDKIRVTPKAANCLADLKQLTKTDEETLNEIEKILVCHFTEILHHPPKMAKYILEQ